jgi:hypothetical protein
VLANPNACNSNGRVHNLWNTPAAPALDPTNGRAQAFPGPDRSYRSRQLLPQPAAAEGGDRPAASLEEHESMKADHGIVGCRRTRRARL